ncbi:MAG: tetratricopeptide repeat protein [Actinomycetota bacterium]|nr:tetratricopeptide repeat protein [Actinomycetota bacterium]
MSEQLKEERDFLLSSLRDLEREREAGEIDDDDYRSLHDDYTARAAVVLRALQREQDVRPGRARRHAAPPRRHGLVVTLGVALLVIAVAGGAVAVFVGGRQPGQSATGSVPVGPAGRLGQALQLEVEGKALEALKVYDSVLAEDPDNVEALAYRGWLLKRAGLVDEAQLSLDRAVKVNPRYADAHFFRGMLLYQDRKDPAGAVAEFRAFLGSNPPPEMVPQVEQVLQRAMADAATSATAPPG